MRERGAGIERMETNIKIEKNYIRKKRKYMGKNIRKGTGSKEKGKNRERKRGKRERKQMGKRKDRNQRKEKMKKIIRGNTKERRSFRIKQKK